MHLAGFYPRLSDQGKRHPVTRGLDGSAVEPPQWGRWFRSIDVTGTDGETVMTADGDRPLLVLNRANEGRVAMLLSDQGWLWARGFEGGGPHVSLYRRIAHWLMKEPELEEEALKARATGRTLEVTRQTIGDAPRPRDDHHALRRNDCAEPERNPARPLSRRTPHDRDRPLHRDQRRLLDPRPCRRRRRPRIPRDDLDNGHAVAISEETRGLTARLDDGDETIRIPDILPVRGEIRVSDDRRMLIS